jgi:hypothetical protein
MVPESLLVPREGPQGTSPEFASTATIAHGCFRRTSSKGADQG